MHIGKMDRLITIQSFTMGRDSEGGITKTWSTGYQVWAEVIPNGGREMFHHEQVEPLVDILFRINFNETVVPDYTQRIVYNSTNYNIYSMRELGYREGWEIMAKAIRPI